MDVNVETIDDAVFTFYEKYGLIALQDSGKMFLPMQTIKKLT